jgi:hypothetical protein
MVKSYVPEMRQSHKDFKELIELSTLYGFDLAEQIRRLSDLGTPIFRADVDNLLTSEAGDTVIVYHLADELLAHLTAMRTKNVHSGVAELPFTHSVT